MVPVTNGAVIILDGNLQRMAIQKTVMETLIEENRKLNETVTKNGERHIETIAFVEKKLNETHEELHKALLAEKSKLN